jgi:hypothetical protein
VPGSTSVTFRDVFALPAARAELAAQQLRRVDLHHDPGVEVESRVEVQISGVLRAKQYGQLPFRL